MGDPVVATYSIVGCDLAAGQWGVATQSKFLAVGSLVPWAQPGIGAVATQSYVNPQYGPDGLALLRDGLDAQDVGPRPTSAGPGRGARLYELHALLFGKTPRDQWVDVDEALRLEVTERLTRLGYAGDLGAALAAWAGTENLEERVHGIDRLDPVVLAELRSR